jgi:predicted amidohydrolase YtcJ
MVVVYRDYLAVPADEIRDIRPVATIVNGTVVHGNL